MAYPTTLITDTTPGVDIYPPQSGQAFGTYSGSPVGTANPDHPTWMKRTSDELVSIEQALGLPSNPAVGSILYQINQDYGDYAAPASPSAYNDEFIGTLNTTQWTPSGTGTGATIQNVAPSYCQFQVTQGASTTATTLKLTETIVSTSTFMWQTKVRFMLNPVSLTAAGSTYAEIAFVLKNTTASKGFGIFLVAQSFFSAGTGGINYPIQLSCNRGNALATANTSTSLLITGSDLRMRMGISGANLVAQISQDGYNWMTIWSEVFSTGNSLGGSLPNQLYLQMDNAGSLAGNFAGGSMMSSWDYVRMMA